MKTLTKLAGICLLLCLSAGVYAQDIELTNLTFNPAVNNEWNQQQARGVLKPTVDTIPLVDYILDDFSYPGPYPDPGLWLDKYVFINRTYAYAPPSIGVATFDGLNEKGYPYNFLASESSSGGADTLTSVPLDLTLLPSDSVMLSFSYQPQGLGNSPAAKDSLVLEFKEPGQNWNYIWSKKGSPLTFSDTLNWANVKIYITDPKYLKKGFQFRFRNYATLSGSFDHWHIDYVYLVNTKKFNVEFKDVTYVYNLPSLIKTYQAMPFRQYTKAYAKTMISTPVRNNHSAQITANYAYSVKDDMGNTLYSTPFYGYPLDPYSKSGCHLDTLSNLPELPLLNRITSFYLETYHEKSNDFKVRNDTVRSEQKFGYYYAYDDGTAESAFGLKKANSSLAIKYELNVQDTLRYVDIYFNPTLINASSTNFNLKVWGDGSGQPGPEIASSRSLTPRYSKTGPNNIIRYGMDAPLVLPPGIYYIGFFQAGNIPLNIGLDMNTNSQFNTFYKSGIEDWNTMPYPGSTIFHPVFGFDSTVVSVPNIAKEEHFVDIYPNPVRNDLVVRTKDSQNHELTYTIYDVSGREVEKKKIATPSVIDVSQFENGIYFIQLQEGELRSTLKFIKIE
ncbi:MAG TPA: T9SS type A sorting domain-containing protein [Bacteroidia bacterium]|jgi:hypothetical protein|nr:T9SS type A sorting domain-containing protein [Bacteroidia bacterium]